MSKVPALDLDALMGQELNDIVCHAYRMCCEQTREVYQKRIEKLEAALRAIATDSALVRYDVQLICRIALEEKDD